MTEEVWKFVDGYDGRYSVSNHGRVRSHDMMMGNRHQSKTIRKGRILKPSLDGKKYLNVKLCLNGKQTSVKVHRLVAMCFVPNVGGKPQVNHIDGVKQNNHASNLEWCTNTENIVHAYQNGLIATNNGERHHNARITEDGAQDIIKRMNNGESLSSISRLYSVSVTSIWNMKVGKTWSHLTR